MDLICALSDSEPEKEKLIETQNELIGIYASLSNIYHEEKVSNENNSLVLG